MNKDQIIDLVSESTKKGLVKYVGSQIDSTLVISSIKDSLNELKSDYKISRFRVVLPSEEEVIISEVMDEPINNVNVEVDLEYPAEYIYIKFKID